MNIPRINLFNIKFNKLQRIDKHKNIQINIKIHADYSRTYTHK